MQTNTNNIQTITYIQAKGADSLVSVQFYDTYGRPTSAGRTGLTSGDQIYSSQSYDALGRTTKTWAPTPVNTSQYQDFDAGRMNSLSLNFFNDSVCYTETKYDALDRPKLSYVYSQKGTSFSYGINTSEGLLRVRLYTVVANNTLSAQGYWPKGQLQYKSATSPDGNETITFTDDRGLTILERHIVEKSQPNAQQNDTYYVYDDMGRLIYVLPPQCQSKPTNLEYMKKYWYRYEYDAQGQVISKQLPGCDSVSYTYDFDGNVTSMQDGVLRAAGKKRTYSYDNLFRLIKQRVELASSGVHKASSVIPEIENFYDIYQKINYTGLSSTDTQFLKALPNQVNKPGFLVASRQYASNGELMMSVYCYDDKGRVTESRSVGISGERSISQFEYDYVGKILKETCRQYKGDVLLMSTVQENKYDSYHSQLLTQSILTLTDSKGNVRTDTISDVQYDKLGNVTRTARAHGRANMDYTYDLLRGGVKSITSTSGFEQHLYRETEGKNKRWDGSISAMTWKTGADDVERRYDYTYDGLNRLVDAAYSEKSQSASAAMRRFDWEDDNIGILPDPQIHTQGNYGEHIVYDMNSNIIQMQRSGMLNDKSYGLIDNLGISYDGNQRTKIADAEQDELDYSNAFDFRDGSEKEQEYAYNQNGALIKDLNKDITNIEYDLLGNPKKVSFADNRSIEYIYSADGRRLRTIYKKIISAKIPIRTKTGKITNTLRSSVSTDSTDYVGNLILKNNKPQMYRFSGGYYDFNADGALADCHYYISDYMGNNRMVVNYDGTIEQITHYYAYGGIIGDLSTNESLQSFKFEDKELDRTYGLDWYDIQARQYDALAPIWNAIDPLAEKYYRFSPYNFCMGNPINFGDYNGMETNSTTNSFNWLEFQQHIVNGGSLSDFDFSQWETQSDEEFLENLADSNSQVSARSLENGESTSATQSTETQVALSFLQPFDDWSTRTGVVTAGFAASRESWDFGVWRGANGRFYNHKLISNKVRGWSLYERSWNLSKFKFHGSYIPGFIGKIGSGLGGLSLSYNLGQVASNPTFDTGYDLLNSGVGTLGLPGAIGSVFMTIYKDTYKRCANGTASDFDWYNMTNCSGNGFYSISMYMRFK